MLVGSNYWGFGQLFKSLLRLWKYPKRVLLRSTFADCRIILKKKKYFGQVLWELRKGQNGQVLSYVSVRHSSIFEAKVRWSRLLSVLIDSAISHYSVLLEVIVGQSLKVSDHFLFWSRCNDPFFFVPLFRTAIFFEQYVSTRVVFFLAAIILLLFLHFRWFCYYFQRLPCLLLFICFFYYLDFPLTNRICIICLWLFGANLFLYFLYSCFVKSCIKFELLWVFGYRKWNEEFFKNGSYCSIFGSWKRIWQENERYKVAKDRSPFHSKVAQGESTFTNRSDLLAKLSIIFYQIKSTE